jgi:hypothetical protein
MAIRPPEDPYLRKGKPKVDPFASKAESLPELLNRGHQLLWSWTASIIGSAARSRAL